MKDTKKSGNSTLLATLYGEDYQTRLGSGCISFEQEEVNPSNKLFMRVLALFLLSINIVMAAVLFDLWSLLTFLTNWCVMASLFCIAFFVYCSSIPDIKLHKGKLCAAHLLFEFASGLNLVVTLVYWCVIHHMVIENFTGARYVHMFLVHIFPALGLLLLYKSM